jgi:hypothetical protein
MAEADWATMTNALAADDVRKGVSMAPDFEAPDSPSPIGGEFVYYFNTLSADVGISAKYYDVSTYNPTATVKGGTLSACIRRWDLAEGAYPFIALVTSNDIDDAVAPICEGYILGFTNTGSTAQLMLRKGGLEADMKSEDGYLRLSDATYGAGWFQFQLSAIINPQGDVVLSVKENDLTANQPDAPSWAAIDGMADYVDDSGGILDAGSNPPIVGDGSGAYYFVYGVYNAGTAGIANLFDYIVVKKQDNP